MQALPPSQAEIEMYDRKVTQRKRVSPIWLILQGLFGIGLGIYLIVISSGHSYKEITGNIQGIINNGGGSYSLQISTDPNDVYILNTNVSSQLTTGARVDVYYVNNDTQRIVAALQTYDLAGHPTANYVTSGYSNILNPWPFNNTAFDFGLIFLLLGIIWAGLGIVRLVRKRNAPIPSQSIH